MGKTIRGLGKLLQRRHDELIYALNQGWLGTTCYVGENFYQGPQDKWEKLRQEKSLKHRTTSM